MEELNAYLESNSYLGSTVSITLEDYKAFDRIDEGSFNAFSLPHLGRWHKHVSILKAKYPKFDHLGIEIPPGTAPFLKGAHKKEVGKDENVLNFPDSVDIACNILDDQFTKKGDFQDIFKRARDVGVKNLLNIAGYLEESEKTIKLIAEENPKQKEVADKDGGGNTSNLTGLYTSAGVHPTRCNLFLEVSEIAEQDAQRKKFAGGDDAKLIAPASVLKDLQASGQVESERNALLFKPENAKWAYTKHALQYANKLKNLLVEHSEIVCCVGEFGLDYDREMFCARETQQKFFTLQLEKLVKLDSSTRGGLTNPIPMLLHMRGDKCCEDFLAIISHVLYNGGKPALSNNGDKSANSSTFYPGVVHSFTGSVSQMHQIFSYGLDVSVNGLSLKTEENCELIKHIPLSRLHLETDAPYCGIKSTSHGFQHVKTHFKATKKFTPGHMISSRNEPCVVVQVAEVVAALKGLEVGEVIRVCRENTKRVFGI